MFDMYFKFNFSFPSNSTVSVIKFYKTITLRSKLIVYDYKVSLFEIPTLPNTYHHYI